MKKIIIITLGLFLSLKGISQEFMGVKVEGGKSSITNQFTEKGLTKVTSANPNVLIFEGDVNGTNVELYVAFTPKTNVAWKFSVYLPKRTNWYELKGDYEKYVQIFTNKYGAPTTSYSTFLSPYYEGDGYEMSAVSLDKTSYACFWDVYSIEITKYKQVRLGYENIENEKLNREEKNEINNATF